MLDSVQWTEVYRPQSMEEVALEEGTEALITSYLEKGEIPHLLFAGPPGCGKTTLAQVITNELNCKVLKLNASSERGIGTIREKVGTFVLGLFGATWNIVFLDEADALTPEAQTALRNLMETHATTSRFILTCNYPYKIIDAIQSRCQVVQLSAPPVKQRYEVLQGVLDAEEVTHTPAEALAYVNQYTDMRRLLYEVQKAVLSTGKLVPPEQRNNTGPAVWEAILRKDWNSLKAIARDTSTDFVVLMRDLFWAVPDDYTAGRGLLHALTARWKVARGLSELGRAPDPVVHFLGVCCELMEEL